MESAFVKVESAISEAFSMEEAPVPRLEGTLHEGTETKREVRRIAWRTVMRAVVAAAADVLFAPS